MAWNAQNTIFWLDFLVLTKESTSLQSSIFSQGELSWKREGVKLLVVLGSLLQWLDLEHTGWVSFASCSDSFQFIWERCRNKTLNLCCCLLCNVKAGCMITPMQWYGLWWWWWSWWKNALSDVWVWSTVGERGRRTRKYCVATPPSNYSLCQWEGELGMCWESTCRFQPKNLGVKVVKDGRTPKSCVRTELGVNCF